MRASIFIVQQRDQQEIEDELKKIEDYDFKSANIEGELLYL